jgi:hypothetical protein
MTEAARCRWGTAWASTSLRATCTVVGRRGTTLRRRPCTTITTLTPARLTRGAARRSRRTGRRRRRGRSLRFRRVPGRAKAIWASTGSGRNPSPSRRPPCDAVHRPSGTRRAPRLRGRSNTNGNHPHRPRSDSPARRRGLLLARQTRVIALAEDPVSDCRFISLPRFACLLSLGVLGLAGLLWFGIGGIVFVKDCVFRTSNVPRIRERTAPPRVPTSAAGALVASGSGTSAGAAARNASGDASAVAARRRRALTRSDPAPRLVAWTSKNQPEAPTTVGVEGVPAAHAD